MNRPALVAVFGILFLMWACSDSGTEPAPLPEIARIVPDAGAVGDTIRIEGQRFGAARGNGSVTFGGTPAVTYVSWADARIDAVVPAGASTGTVVVTVDGAASNGSPFRVTTPGQGGGISFQGTVQPILATGCALSGCHRPPSPSSGFDQSSYTSLRLGGSRFGAAVIVPGDSANSMIIRAMRGTAPGLGRMPFGGPWVASGVPDSLVVAVGTWIQQGAGNN